MARRPVQVAFHGVVALVLTWPLVLHLTSSLPLGTEDTGTVPLFNLWTLRWNQQQAGDLFRHYWDAPIFHPTPGAFALSEPQPLTGLVFTPISWLTHSPVLAYNVTLLAILLLNGFAAARLARRLGVAPWPAALAGALAQALPFVANELGVLQLTVVFPLFFLWDALVQWSDDGRRKHAVAMGVWLAVTFLTTSYYGLFAVLVGGIAALTLVRRSWFTWARLIDLAVAGAVFALLALPVVIGQAHYTSAYHRSDTTIEENSASPIDYLRLDPIEHGASLMPWLRDEGGSGQRLYPGTALVALAVAGLVIGLRRVSARAQADRDAAAERAEEDVGVEVDAGESPPVVDERRRLLFFLNGACLAVILSLGFNLHFGSVYPYDFIRDHVPGFANLRSPFRFAALAQVFLIPLAAVALDALWVWRARLGQALAIAVVVVGMVEVSPLPQPLLTVPTATSDWVTWLHDHPEDTSRSGAGAVAMVPFPASLDAAAYAPTTQWMLDGLDHGHPIVNGYSGLFPTQYDQLESAMGDFPDPNTIGMLLDRGVSYVVVDRAWLTPARQERIDVFRDQLTPVFTGTDKVVYQVDS